MEARLKSSNRKYTKNRIELYEVRKIRRKGRLSRYTTKLRKNVTHYRKGRPVRPTPKIENSTEFKAMVKWFFEPLTSSPEFNGYDLSIADRISYIMHEKTRDIVLAVADRDFKMPGKFWDSRDGSQRWPTVSEAKIREGTPLFVRIDDTMPERIDIQVGNSYPEDLCFALTKSEYTSIVLNIKEVEGCNYKLNPPGSTEPYSPSISRRRAR